MSDRRQADFLPSRTTMATDRPRKGPFGPLYPTDGRRTAIATPTGAIRAPKRKKDVLPLIRFESWAGAEANSRRAHVDRLGLVDQFVRARWLEVQLATLFRADPYLREVDLETDPPRQVTRHWLHGFASASYKVNESLVNRSLESDLPSQEGPMYCGKLAVRKGNSLSRWPQRTARG